MKSSNSDSGVYVAETTRTLDRTCGNPASNQGGMIIVEKEAKAIHESLGGDSVNISDVAYALRSGRKPLLLEEIKLEATGFDGYNGDLTGDKSATLGVNCGMPTGRNGVINAIEAAGFDAIQITSKNNRSSVDFSNPYPTLCKDSNPYVITAHHEINLHPNIAPTLTASAGGTSRPGGGQGNELDYYIAYSLQGNMIGRADHNGPQGNGINENNCFTLNATDQHAVAFFNFHDANCRVTEGNVASCQTARQHKSATDLIVQKWRKHFIDTGMMSIKGSEVAETQTARQHKSTMDYVVSLNEVTRHMQNGESFCGVLKFGDSDMEGSDETIAIVPYYIVRRLTPIECERLQGFPDDWTKHGADSDKPIADTPRYQMLGNSIAIPKVRFILNNIVDAEGRNNAKNLLKGVDNPRSLNRTL